MKNILLLVHDDAGQEARLQAALDLTRALEGHLTCIDVIEPPVVVGDLGGTGSAMLFAENREVQAENRKKIETHLAKEDVQWNWAEAVGNIADCVTAASGLSDLIVLNRQLDKGAQPDMRAIVGEIALKARTPIVAVSDEARGFNANGAALIAWNGSEPAMATLRACVPLLKLASRVRLLVVDDGAIITPAEDAAVYLSRHGITADIAVVADGLRAPDAIIADECGKWHADYCVIGAYSRSRLIQTLFGGVTRRLLASSRIPLVLGH